MERQHLLRRESPDNTGNIVSDPILSPFFQYSFTLLTAPRHQMFEIPHRGRYRANGA